MEQNTIRRPIFGIELFGADDNLVKRNVSEDHGEGILLTASDDNVIRGNQVSTGVIGLHLNGAAIAGDTAGLLDPVSENNRYIATDPLRSRG